MSSEKWRGKEISRRGASEAKGDRTKQAYETEWAVGGVQEWVGQLIMSPFFIKKIF